MNPITIVIVTYNSAGHIERCVESCGALPVIVVDNASADDTLDRVRRYATVHLIANRENVGFAKGVNQAVAAAHSPFLLLLNPDVELETPVDALVEACSRPGAGIAAGLLRDSHGGIQAGSARRFPTAATLAAEVLGLNRIFPRNRWNRAYRYLDRNLLEGGEVDQPAGAFLLFRRDLWARLEGFDERFSPVWFEDVDFCKRAKDCGYRAVLVPGVHAKHEGGHSIATLDWECRERYWYVSLLKYASKHFTPWQRRKVGAAVVPGSLIRAMIGAVQKRSWRPIPVYAGIIRLACVCLWSGRVDEKRPAAGKMAVNMQQ